MCETSKTPASARTARCSGMTPSYCTGISQPAKGTRRAPAATWRSWSGVRRSVCTARTLVVPASSDLLFPGSVLPEEGRDLELLVGALRTTHHRLAVRRLLGLRRLDPPAPLGAAEARRNHGHAHLVAER